jgi:hypothetical protein
MYLSPIQHGIQSGHAVTELFVKYDKPQTPEEQVLRDMVYDHATNHKTWYVLNGGMTEHLEPALDVIKEVGLPWATFYEPGIGDALTAIAVIVPERIYEFVDNRKRGGKNTDLADVFAMFGILDKICELSKAELAFIELLAGLSLAR